MSTPLSRGEIRGDTATMKAIAEKDDHSAVGIKLTVHGISNIDQVAGTFCVDVTLHMWWLETGLKSRCAKLDADVVPITDQECLVPHFHFENSLSVEPVEPDEPEIESWRQSVQIGIPPSEQENRVAEFGSGPHEVQFHFGQSDP